MDRIKRLSYEVLDKHKLKFGEDFADNKKVLDQIAIIRSKGLKNEIAGYITKFIKKEIHEEQEKQSQIEADKLKVAKAKLKESSEESTDSVESSTLTTETPAEPEILSETTIETSTEPITETPTEPITETPTEPITETPTIETPAEPTSTNTSESAADNNESKPADSE